MKPRHPCRPHQRLRPGARPTGVHLGVGDEGQVTAFVVVMMAALLLVAGLVYDGGLALAAKVRAADEAQEAARAGAQQIDLDAYRATGTVTLLPDQAQAAALDYLAATGNPDAPAATVTVTGDQVAVTVIRHQPTLLLSLAGLDSLTVHGAGTAEALYGINAPTP